MQKKRVKWLVAGAVTILVIVATPFVLRLAVQWAFPDECDEGMADDRRAANSRGDLVASYFQACGFGVSHESIALRLAGAEDLTTLIEMDELNNNYPKFSWIDDDTMYIDLGRVYRISSPVRKVGRICIIYSYKLGH